MNISVEVTEELLDYLESKVEEGLFKSRSEVVRAAIREMIQKDLQYQLKEKGLSEEEMKRLREEECDKILEEKFEKLRT
ncbi:MAG: ribbon-helix-helix domain-containing protein [Candidatus Natronoplasma sp.]